MIDQRRVRHDLDLIIVVDAPDHATPLPLKGRVVAFEDGRWSLGVPVGGRWVELTGDRWSNGRAVAMLLLGVSRAGPG